MQKKEAVYLIKHSQFQKVVDYVMSVPTGTLPGSRLAETLNILDNLTMVPAQAVPTLEQALRQMAQPHGPAPPIPTMPVSTPPVDGKPSNGAEAPSTE